jgi:hypothetical protein
MLLTEGDKELPIAIVFFLLNEFIIHLKICGCPANLQQFHDGFDWQGRSFLQRFIILKLISDDL